MLVNNVGIMYNGCEYFHSHPDNFHRNLINANIMSATMMSEIVLRIMVKQKDDPKRKNPAKGVVINLSSFLGCAPFPLFNSYCACKF